VGILIKYTTTGKRLFEPNSVATLMLSMCVRCVFLIR